MPTCKQVLKKPAGAISKQSAGVISNKPAAGTGLDRPVFKTGDIVMKAVFDSGVPFSNGVCAAVVTKNTKGPAVVQFVKQLATENLEDVKEARANKTCCAHMKFNLLHNKRCAGFL